MQKALGMMLMLLAVTALFCWSLFGYLRMPIVEQSWSRDVPVACVTAADGRQPADSTVCQTVLRGRYEVEWVK